MGGGGLVTELLGVNWHEIMRFGVKTWNLIKDNKHANR